jgi:D-alanyl-D-alanine carboxypeptidase
LLGLILEEATSQRYAERLQARILDPLGLADTFYAATEPVPGGRVDCYHLIEGELVDVTSIHHSALGAAGGMVSTAGDVARFARALFGGELMSPESLEQMTTFIPVGKPNMEGGMGIFRLQLPDGEIMVGNQGDSPGFAARMFQPVETDLTIVMLTNTGGDDEVVDTIYAQAVDAVGSVAE